MSFQAFLNDPKGYLQTHEMYVSNGAASTQVMTFDPPAPIVGGLQRLHWHQRGAGPFPTMAQLIDAGANFAPAPNAPKGFGTKLMDVVRHAPLVNRKRIQYTIATSHNETNFRYLPFNPDHVTYMRINPPATFCLTGPLTGCTIAIVRGGAGSLWLLHGNDNRVAGAAARASQWAGITDVITNRIGVPIGGAQECRYTRDYDGFGFVFGHLRGNVWKFYSHATSQGGVTTTRKWGEI